METVASKNQNPLKVAVYARVGSDNQLTDNVVEIQRQSLLNFALRNGLNVHKEYMDIGYNGNTLVRPGLAQMENDIKAGDINAVIVRNIDRIARDFILCSDWLSKMKSEGVEVIAMDNLLPLIPSVKGYVSALQKPTGRGRYKRNKKRR